MSCMENTRILYSIGGCNSGCKSCKQEIRTVIDTTAMWHLPTYVWCDALPIFIASISSWSCTHIPICIIWHYWCCHALMWCTYIMLDYWCKLRSYIFVDLCIYLMSYIHIYKWHRVSFPLIKYQNTPGKIDILINKCPYNYMWKCMNPDFEHK